MDRRYRKYNYCGDCRITVIENLMLEDIPAIIELGKLAHAESKYAHLPYSPKQVEESFTNNINDKTAFSKKAVIGGIVGFFIGYKSGFIFTDVPIALETCYYIAPEYRGSRIFIEMMKLFNEWAGDSPQVTMPHFANNNTKTYSTLEKLGFKEAGRIYIRGMQWVV